MSSFDLEAQGEMKQDIEGVSASLSDSNDRGPGKQLGLRPEEQNSNGEKICETDLEPDSLSNLYTADVNSLLNAIGHSASNSKTGTGYDVKTTAAPTHLVRESSNKISQKISTPNRIPPEASDVNEGSSPCIDTCSAVKADCSDVFGDVSQQMKVSSPSSAAVDLSPDVPLGSSASKTQIKDLQPFEGTPRGAIPKDEECFPTTSANLDESSETVCCSVGSIVLNAKMSGEPPQDSCRKKDGQTLPGASARQGNYYKRHCLPPNHARIKEKFNEAKKYSHLCPKLSKVPKVHLKRLLFVKSEVKPVSGELKKDKTTEAESGVAKSDAVTVRTSGSIKQMPPCNAVRSATATVGMPKFNAVKTATGKDGRQVLKALGIKPHPRNFFTPAKRVIRAAGNKVSKGVGANTVQSLQVVVVHPKSHKVQTNCKSPTLERYRELLNQLKEAVPGFETAQTENKLLHPGEPGMPLKSYCTCGVAGSEYATKYHFSPDDRRALEINNVTRVVVNGFAFLAFYRQDKLYLSYAELVEMQVMDSSAVSFPDLLKEYPPTIRKSTCVDIMTHQEFAYLQFRNGPTSSLGLITIGMFRRLVLQGQIKWKVFENPKFAGLPLGHLCPKTARDMFFYPHSIFDIDKISQAPAASQKDYTMHVGQICFVQNPIWVFECSKIVFINLKQFFLENQLGDSMLQTAFPLLHRLGVLLADAPEAVCNTILSMDFDPRKPLTLCSPWVRLRSLGQVLEEIGAQPSMEAGSSQQALVQRMAWLVKEIRSQDILWRTDVAFSY